MSGMSRRRRLRRYYRWQRYENHTSKITHARVDTSPGFYRAHTAVCRHVYLPEFNVVEWRTPWVL